MVKQACKLPQVLKGRIACCHGGWNGLYQLSMAGIHLSGPAQGQSWQSLDPVKPYGETSGYTLQACKGGGKVSLPTQARHEAEVGH